MTFPRVLRLRCPMDDGSPEHVAIDVRLPLAVSRLTRLIGELHTCPCGAAFVIGEQGEGEERGT